MSLPLPKHRYIEAIRDDHHRLLAAASGAMDAPIEACPEWDNAALLDHLGDVFNFAVTQIRAEATEMTAPDMAAKADSESWYRRSADALLAALDETEPDRPGWSWAGVPTLSFYFRRMACEIAVHRIDAQRAAGLDEDPIDADIATDGVDEVFQVGMQFRIRGPNDQFPRGSLHLHRTDGEGEWLVRGDDGGLVLTHEHAKGDAAVRGPASDLMLYLWGRGPGRCEIFGDESVAAAWAAVAP